MPKLLFNDFDAVSSKQWKQKIKSDLKGADYNSTLLTETNEGITINPFYHQDTAKYIEVSVPTETFKICQTIFVDDVTKANTLARNALKRGASALLFEANEPFEIEVLFDQLVIPKKSGIHFKLNFLSQSFVAELVKTTSQYTVFLNIDIIGNLAKSGNWFTNKNKDHEVLGSRMKNTMPNISVLGVDAGLYQNAGANTVQQVAYTLAHVNEYLNAFADEKLANKIQFTFAVGGHYFLEIAKLRAFRYLFSLIIKEYDLDITPEIFVQPTLRNKSIYDYNINMLRTTTEGMSAILGGADCISNIDYDTIYHKSNEFGERIARNQLLILQEESYFKVLEQKNKEWEDLCIRCGGCCGVFDDPCVHLGKNKDNKVCCEIYANRLGLRKTIKDEEFKCIPVKAIIYTYWKNEHLCRCKRHLKSSLA